jgi:hypothetical protein
MASSALSLAHLSYLIVDSQTFGRTIRRLTCKKGKWCHRQQQLNTFNNNETAKDEDLDLTASHRHWRHEAISCLSDLIAIGNLWACHSLVNISSLNIQRALMHIVWCYSTFIFLSTISFLVYQILSSECNLLSPSFPESRDEIPFKGGTLSHPEISILECELFFSINLNFQKDFIWFKLKWFILFYFVFKWVQRINIFKWCSNFSFKLFIHLSCEIFQTKSYSKEFSSHQPSFKRVYKSL